VFSVKCPKGIIRFICRRGWGCTAWSLIVGGDNYPVWPNYDTYEELRVIKRKKASEQASAAQHIAPVESTLLAKHHAIVAHCACTKYDDGDPRKPGWITVKTIGSAWQVEAKDPDTCSRLTVVQATIDDALTLLAMLLESEEAPWEKDPWLMQQESKQKKK